MAKQAGFATREYRRDVEQEFVDELRIQKLPDRLSAAPGPHFSGRNTADLKK